MKTLCFSDNVIDYYQNTSEMFPGGNAVNVAVHLAKQQVDSHYLGHFGDDAMGQVIIKALKEHGVIFDHSKVVKNSTTKHCIYSIKDGERTFVKVELGKNWQGRFPLDEQLLDYMNEFDVIISSCNSKMEDEMRKIGQLKPIFVYDFGEKEKYRDEPYLKKVCPGLDLAMLSFSGNLQEAKQLAAKLLALGTKNVLFTLGARGQLLINEQLELFHPITLVKAKDTMGAGDSFLSAFILSCFKQGYHKGELIKENQGWLALEAGSAYSQQNCLIEGAFGNRIVQ